jgi:hypothetical protein
MSIRKSFAISLFIHGALLYAMGLNFNKAQGFPGGNSDAKQDNKAVKDSLDGKQIVEKPTEVTLVEQPKPEVKGPGKKVPKHKKMTTCKQSFGGVGILYANHEGEVEIAYTGYPAANAGIMTGDIILNAGEIRGPIGSLVTINVLRGSLNLNFEVTRAKICLNDDL